MNVLIDKKNNQYNISPMGGSKVTSTSNTKHMKHTKDRALHRLKIVQGHIDSISKMIEDDAYCLDVVHQSRAVQKALHKLDVLLIEDHLSHCVVDQVKSGQEQKTTKELLTLYEYK